MPWKLPPSYSLTNTICLLCSPHILTNIFFHSLVLSSVLLSFDLYWMYLYLLVNLSIFLSYFSVLKGRGLFHEISIFILSLMIFPLNFLIFLLVYRSSNIIDFIWFSLFLTLQISFLMLHLCSCYVKYSWNRQLQTDKVKFPYLSHYILCFEILKKSSPTQSSQRYFLHFVFLILLCSYLEL